MAAAISIFTILTLSVVVVRIGAVALRLTGTPGHVARFQARSAFTGTGFTTPEASLVVNHPDRRRVISVLMVLGSAGFVSTIAAVVLSYVDFEATRENLIQEAVWLAGLALAIWLVAFSKLVERQMSRVIRWVLEHTTRLAVENTTSLLLLGDGYHVLAITIGTGPELDGKTFEELKRPGSQGVPLAVFRQDGSLLADPHDDTRLAAGETLIVYGRLQAFTSPQMGSALERE